MYAMGVSHTVDINIRINEKEKTILIIFITTNSPWNPVVLFEGKGEKNH